MMKLFDEKHVKNYIQRRLLKIQKHFFSENKIVVKKNFEVSILFWEF